MKVTGFAAGHTGWNKGLHGECDALTMAGDGEFTRRGAVAFDAWAARTLDQFEAMILKLGAAASANF